MSLKRNKSIRNNTIDIFIVLLQITYGMCIVQAFFQTWIFIPLYLDLILVTFFAYVIRFKKCPFVIRRHLWILLLFLFIYLLDFLQNFSIDFTHAVVRLFFLIDIVVFVQYLCAMYYYGGSYKVDLGKVTAPLAYFSLYNVIVIFLCLFLLLTGVLSINNNILSDNPLIHDNYVNGQIYSFPGFLSIVLHNSNRVLSVFNIPALSGLTHEPHVLFYLIGPGYFLLLEKCKTSKQSVWLGVLFFFALIASSSTTAILVFSVCLFIDFCWKSVLKKEYKHIIYLVLFIIPVALIIVYFFGEAFEFAQNMLDAKVLGSDNSSKGTSEAMIDYVISPKKLFGCGNMPSGVFDDSLSKLDIGLVTSVLDILLFAILIFVSITNIMSRNRQIHYIGLATFYYLLHNLKLSFQGFNFVYLSYIIVLSLLTFTINRKEKALTQR